MGLAIALKTCARRRPPQLDCIAENNGNQSSMKEEQVSCEERKGQLYMIQSMVLAIDSTAMLQNHLHNWKLLHCCIRAAVVYAGDKGVYVFADHLLMWRLPQLVPSDCNCANITAPCFSREHAFPLAPDLLASTGILPYNRIASSLASHLSFTWRCIAIQTPPMHRLSRVCAAELSGVKRSKG